MWRKAKLFINFFIAASVFTYFILILILLLNPFTKIDLSDFPHLYKNLLIYYGPLWFIVIGSIFFIIQFFSEKKYPIGFFSPPSITYFLSFTMMIITIVMYFNYDYYYAFFTPEIKTRFIKILLVNLILIILSIIFVFFKKIKKNWSQTLFLLVLLANIFNSFYSVQNTSSLKKAIEVKQMETLQSKITHLAVEGQSDGVIQENPQRKIRIVIMDGLSLSLLEGMYLEEKLLNFRHLIQKGVRGKFDTFKPNLDLSLINSALTGLGPSQFTAHSNKKYKFTNVQADFEVFPRYIFFRNSPFLDVVSFYKEDRPEILDKIGRYYENHHFKTWQAIKPYQLPRYSKKALHKKNSFVLRFSEILKKEDPKYDILKKAFFQDDYMKSIIPDLRDSQKYYAVTRLPGLGIVSKHFYQYHNPNQFFSNISENDIKRYGLNIEKYYDYYDSIIGNLLTTTGDNELLVIISFFEYEPLPVWRRILVNLYGQKDIYVYKSLTSRGTIFLYAKEGLKKDYPLENISILDIFPTLVYYGGFKISKDLPGQVIKEIFTEDFQLHNPIDIGTEYIKFK